MPILINTPYTSPNSETGVYERTMKASQLFSWKLIWSALKREKKIIRCQTSHVMWNNSVILLWNVFPESRRGLIYINKNTSGTSAGDFNINGVLKGGVPGSWLLLPPLLLPPRSGRRTGDRFVSPRRQWNQLLHALPAASRAWEDTDGEGRTGRLGAVTAGWTEHNWTRLLKGVVLKRALSGHLSWSIKRFDWFFNSRNNKVMLLL